MIALTSPTTTPARAAGGVAVGGLSHIKQVSTDTFRVDLSRPACAERRVSRLKRSVWASGHLHALADVGFRPPVCWFVTLTYARADAWQARHVSDAIKRFRLWCKSLKVPCRYTWVGEIQPKRLASTGDAVVHYHLLAWLPPGVNMRHWDKVTDKRQAFWPHGMTQTEVAKSGVGYLMKYLSKLGELTKFPKGLRLYGIGGLDESARKTRAWYNLPSWAKLGYGVGQLARRAGGLCDLSTGEILPPAFKLRHSPSEITFTALREITRRFSLRDVPPGVMPGAYSAWSPT